MVVGAQDTTSKYVDALWTKDQIGPAVLDIFVVPGSHSSYMIGTDMRWYKEIVVEKIKLYLPVKK